MTAQHVVDMYECFLQMFNIDTDKYKKNEEDYVIGFKCTLEVNLEPLVVIIYKNYTTDTTYTITVEVEGSYPMSVKHRDYLLEPKVIAYEH